MDGHARAYFGTRAVQKTHVARLKFPAPATAETWVADANGDPVFVVIGEPSQSLAGELRALLPELRQIAGQRRVTVCFDRGGWSPALFADLLEAELDLLTYRKGHIPDLPDAAFTAASHLDEHGRDHRYDLAEATAGLAIASGRRAGQTVVLRQVTRRSADRRGRIRQVHILTSRQAADLPAAEVAYRASSRWREENYFRYGTPQRPRKRPATRRCCSSAAPPRARRWSSPTRSSTPSTHPRRPRSPTWTPPAPRPPPPRPGSGSATWPPAP